MQLALKNLYSCSEDLLPSIEERWQKALAFFRQRKQVVFISDRYRFWEPPGFVQQSLANLLVENGIRVTWFDGVASGRAYQPHISRPHPLLEVHPLQTLLGRRFSWIDSLNVNYQTKQISDVLKNQNPVVWVQGSLDNRISKALPHVDVYSVFDDPFLHTPGDVLTEKAQLILSQNAFSDDLYRSHYPQKTRLALPPVELNENVFFSSSPRELLPAGFPTKIMGYLGACFSEGFDFDLLEKLILSCPDWGFLIVGRTDSLGMEKIQKLEKNSNFIYRSWIPRQQLASVWQLLDVNLMLYRPCRSNAGAYPVKFLESLYFGVPSVGTQVPKTSSLEGIIPLSSSVEELRYFSKAEAHLKKDRDRVFQSLFYEMHPKIYLSKVAEDLSRF